MSSNRLPVVAFRASRAGVWAPTPSFFTRPPPSPTAHGHLQRPPKGENMAGWCKVLNVYVFESRKKETIIERKPVNRRMDRRKLFQNCSQGK